MRRELERFLQEKYFCGLQQKCFKESMYSVSRLMHIETKSPTIVGHRNFQANFEGSNGLDLINTTFVKHREPVTDVEG